MDKTLYLFLLDTNKLLFHETREILSYLYKIELKRNNPTTCKTTLISNWSNKTSPNYVSMHEFRSQKKKSHEVVQWNADNIKKNQFFCSVMFRCHLWSLYSICKTHHRQLMQWTRFYRWFKSSLRQIWVRAVARLNQDRLLAWSWPYGGWIWVKSESRWGLRPSPKLETRSIFFLLLLKVSDLW